MTTASRPTTRPSHSKLNGRPAPLAGVRVIAIEQYGAAPFGTLFLADLGADVIKIEDPSVGGDVSRYVPPGQSGTDSLFFEAFNRGKRSLALDLKSPTGRAVFERLVLTADAVISNLRGDQAARLGLTYEVLGRTNPAIVCVTLSAYGRHGDRASMPGYDALIQAESGWASLTGDPGDPPTKSGLSLSDYGAGLTAVFGLMVGLFDASRTGRGRDVDTNLYDSALAMLSYPATWFLSSGFTTERYALSAHPSIVPFQFFATADGYVAVATPKEKFFKALLAGMDLSALAEDPRFEGFESRQLHRTDLLKVLSARFATASTAHWIGRLRGSVPIAPVRSFEQALDEDEVAGRGMLAEYDHPTLGSVRSIGLPMQLSEFEPTYGPGPILGSDRDPILIELGYSEQEIQELGMAGAFGVVDRSDMGS